MSGVCESPNYMGPSMLGSNIYEYVLEVRLKLASISLPAQNRALVRIRLNTHAHDYFSNEIFVTHKKIFL